MLKRNIIRVNDSVKIINPEIVLRWGYPLTKKIVKDTLITQEQKDSIYTMMEKFRGRPLSPNDIFGNIVEDGTYDKVLDLMAYDILKNKGFGGPERKLFILQRESLRDKFGCVSEKKIVKTGTYFAGKSYTSYYSGDDYEPPYLAEEKTHVLCRIFIDYGQEGVCPNINEEGGIWIERKNLEKVLESEL